MSEKREFQGISLKDALQRAAEVFDVAEEKIKYSILTEKTKYFGHKNREIYIQAWLSDGGDLDGLKEFSREMIKAMQLSLTFDIEEQPEFVRLHFCGDDYRLMLFQNANLLNAMQYLLNRLFSDNLGKKIYCECENFRKKKERELSDLAHRLAKKIRRGGSDIQLAPMNPFERRIIHMTINRYSDLESKSEGDHFLKVLTIRKKGNGR